MSMKDKSDELEFTLTVVESDAFLKLIELYRKGERHLKELKKKGINDPPMRGKTT